MGKKLIIRLGALLAIVAICLFGGLAWWVDAVSSPDPVNLTSKTFTISQGEGIRSIATRLKAEGLIKDTIGFFLQIKLLGLESKIQAGDFRLNPAMNAKTVANALTHGSIDVWVTIPEGWRNEEIALKFAQTLAIPETEFLRLANQGYMFPDTYLFPREASAAAAIHIFEKNFENRVTSEIRTGIAAQGLSFADGVILASIVEREGRNDIDRPIIAGILYNRLRDDHPLQADATLQYILGYQSAEKSWWKKTLYNEDKTLDSPFNTYKNIGLPPEPISNPGLGALKAVANPVVTDYYYYLHDTQGTAHFAKDLKEHNENVAKYL